jgi:signal transduction histidine kinase
MNQVIVNLLSNAIKFSAPGKSVNATSGTVENLVKNYVELRIIDNGRGIPNDKLQSIFNRFEQISTADATEKGGSGLGLSICSEIVRAHGGEIGVDSKEGVGSCFWVRLTPAK